MEESPVNAAEVVVATETKETATTEQSICESLSSSTLDSITESQKSLASVPLVLIDDQQQQTVIDVPVVMVGTLDAVEAIATVVEYEPCSRCPITAEFEDPDTHAVYCSDKCRDEARLPEKSVICLVTRDLLCEIPEQSGEKRVYSSENDTVVCTLLMLKPPQFGELEFNEDGTLLFPEDHEPLMMYHPAQLCVLRIEQGTAQIDVFDCIKKLRASYHLHSARRDQCIVPRGTCYSVRNINFDVTLKLSRTLIKQ